MKILPLTLSDVMLLMPQKHEDDRGFFVETFREDAFNHAVGKSINFVQENCSFSKPAYTVRGLHAQRSPHAQGKLVRCVRGAIRDIVVDIRSGSSTYGQSASADLSGKNMNMLWVPAGFLHGFVTLEPDTEVNYKCTDYYAPECAINVHWQDPDLNLGWGVDPELAILSENDKIAQSFRSFELNSKKNKDSYK